MRGVHSEASGIVINKRTRFLKTYPISTILTTDFLCVPTALWQQMQRETDERSALSDGLSLTLLALGHDLRQDLQLLQAAVKSTSGARPGELIARLAKKCEQAAITATVMRANGKPTSKRLVAIQPLLQDAYQQWHPEAERKGLVLSLQTPNVEVLTNPFWLGVILSNLVGNAVQHTISGSVTVDLSAGNNQWVLTVRDSGPGLPARTSKNRHDVTVSRPRRAGTGLGIGLQLVKHAAALLGHSLTISSGSNGSTIRLHIPQGAPTVALLANAQRYG